jgi:hypothetical protein
MLPSPDRSHRSPSARSTPSFERWSGQRSPAAASYRTSDAQGRVEARVQLEATRMVVSFVQEGDYTSEAVGQVVDFLQRLKRRTRQDSAGLVLDGELLYL